MPIICRGASTEANAVSENRPSNVIVMICDDLGYRDIYCYGSSLKTPNLDRMAAEGARLTRSYLSLVTEPAI